MEVAEKSEKLADAQMNLKKWKRYDKSKAQTVTKSEVGRGVGEETHKIWK